MTSIAGANYSEARLGARPHAQRHGPRAESRRKVLDHALAGMLDDALVYVPQGYAHEPAGLLLMLHGAGGTPARALGLVKVLADLENVIAVAPKSKATSWDVLHEGLGPDVARIDRVLSAVFDAYPIDPMRVAIGGFSDGASYALTLGLANGRLFRAILAFSPGAELAPSREGAPHIFISHGRHDDVLPIHRTSRRLVPQLARRGYRVEYVEFDGGHTIPLAIAASAFAWFQP